MFFVSTGQYLVLLDLYIFLFTLVIYPNANTAGLISVSTSASQILPLYHLTVPHVALTLDLLIVTLYLSTLFFSLTSSVSICFLILKHLPV